MGILDFLTGEAQKDTIEFAQKAHQLRQPARDQMDRGRKMFHELAKEKNFRQKFVRDLKGHLSKDLVKDEEHAIQHINRILDALEHSIKDDVMIAHLMIQALMEFITEDTKIAKQGFSHATASKLVQECEQNLVQLKKTLFNYSTVLKQESAEN